MQSLLCQCTQRYVVVVVIVWRPMLSAPHPTQPAQCFAMQEQQTQPQQQQSQQLQWQSSRVCSLSLLLALIGVVAVCAVATFTFTSCSCLRRSRSCSRRCRRCTRCALHTAVLVGQVPAKLAFSRNATFASCGCPAATVQSAPRAAEQTMTTRQSQRRRRMTKTEAQRRRWCRTCRQSSLVAQPKRSTVAET